MKQKQIGFTLVEMMITIAIAALVVTVALPGFNDFMARNTRTSTINEFVWALKLARSEAVTGGARVTVCKSADGKNCIANNFGYEQGWLIFRDSDGDADVADPEDIIKAHAALPPGWTLIGNNPIAKNYISYQSLGIPIAAGLGITKFTLSKDGEHACAIVISSGGRIRLDEDDESNDNCNKW